MYKRKIIFSLLAIIFLMGIILSLIISSSKSNSLEVVFLDVGQGDAILISEGSTQLLIDGGKDGKILLQKLGKYVPFWDRKLEEIVVTHPDQDHIGGLVSVLKTYQVDAIVETNMQSDSETYKKMESEIENNGSEKIEAKKNLKFTFPSGALAEVIYPTKSLTGILTQDTNSQSVVVKLSYGESSFLFTGDLPTEAENELLSSGTDLHSTFLKVAHHGSKYATSNEFLDAVKPQEAIISVGKNNTYGHPNQEVLSRLWQHGINVFRTDQLGDIVYSCQNMQLGCLRVVR